ncbi:MAG: energy transducer TonB [Bdellovibrionales bacterium]|nr:energy transducer TonB [Bdellovibrionales bacterium]
MIAGRFVLENQKGEVVRTFSIESEELFLIYRHDMRRVELVSSLKALDKEEVQYDLLKKTTANAVKRRSVDLGNGGKFRFAKEIEKLASLVQVKDDSEEQEQAIYKRTVYTQAGAMLFILIVGLLIEPLFMKKQEEPVVVVIPQEFIQKKEAVTVQATQKKIDPVKKVANKRVESKVKPVTKTLTQRVKTARKENAPLRTKVKVENVGALGVLGGMKNGSKNSAGFNMKALNDSRGTSWNGAGSGGVGGMERAVPGAGLVASAMGNGGPVEGGGGYGTRGKAGGGRPGYGTMGMGGTAAAYFEPVQEEALVEGGLSMDQIAAVINRHRGEWINCYEKGLQVKSGLSGRVNVKFTINGSGIVTASGIGESSLNSAQVEGCIASRIRTWKFPKPVGGVNVKVQYPFVAKRMNHG